MSVYYFDSFDGWNYPNELLDRDRWGAPALTYAQDGLNGSISFASAEVGPGRGVSSNGYDGGLAITSYASEVYLPIPVGMPALSCGCLYKNTNGSLTDNSILWTVYSGAGYHVRLVVKSTGAIVLQNSLGAVLATSAAGVLSAGVWQHNEFKAVIHPICGGVSVRVEEVEVLNYSGPTRQVGYTSNAIGGVGLKATGTAVLVDDVYVTKAEGLYPGMLGKARVGLSLPEQDGESVTFDRSYDPESDPVEYHFDEHWQYMAHMPVEYYKRLEKISGAGVPAFDLYLMQTIAATNIRSVQAVTEFYVEVDPSSPPGLGDGSPAYIVARWSGGNNNIAQLRATVGASQLEGQWGVYRMDVDPETGAAWDNSGITNKQWGMRQTFVKPFYARRFGLEVLHGGNPYDPEFDPCPVVEPKRRPWAQIIEAYAHG